MIRALVCDDEQIARRRLENMLGRIEGVEMLESATGGVDVLTRIAAHDPDVVFLDIEMPGFDGFEVVEELARREGPAPLIVFATAFPEFARSAFDTGAVDFLTKPVLMSRLEKAMARLESAIADRSAQARIKDLAWQLDALRGTGMPLGDDPHVWIQGRGESFRLSLDRIDMVRAESEYVRLVIGEASYLYREALGDFLERLDPRKFVRVHRSLILNRRMIAAVRRRATGSYRVVTTDGADLPVGKSFRQAVRSVVNG